MVRTRFAPSPTGSLHIGGARTALFNWLFARHQGGQFVLRVEDTDEARNTEEARGGILEGLRWLGLDWDEGPVKNSASLSSRGPHGPYYQSQRRRLYDTAFEHLRQTGRVYQDEGAWRFRFERKPVVVEDLICGEVSVNFRQEDITPDMTVRRPDGSYIFHFVNVVDDLDMEITHVIRGEDHLTNTHKHLQLIEALGGTAPQYAHIPLILNEDGSKMSKRDQGASLAHYQRAGFVPEGVINYLALLGWHPGKGSSDEESEREIFNLDELVARFDLAHVHHKNAAFDLGKCRWMSGQHLHRMPPTELARRATPFLEEAGVLPASPETTEILAKLCRSRVETLAELPSLYAQYANDQPEPDEATRAKALGREGIAEALTEIATAFEAIDGADWNQATIQKAVAEVATAHDLKLGKLMFPLRVATTGAAGGPDLLPFLELLGGERSARKIRHVLGS